MSAVAAGGRRAIALASCAPLPPVEDDEAPLRDALITLGYAVTEPVWDDATVDWRGFAAVILRMTWDYSERLPAFLAWAAQTSTLTRLVHDIDIVRWNTDKRYLRDLSEEEGFALAPTVWLERGDRVALDQLLAGRRWVQGLIKPRIGANARETLRFDVTPAGIAMAQAHLDRLLPDEPLILQAYLPSVEREGELSACFVDGDYTHGVRKTPVGGDFRVQEDYGATDVAHVFTSEELGLAKAIVDAAQRRLGQPLLYARVDFLRSADGALLLNELEIVEPCMFFRHGPHAGQRLAEAVHRLIVTAG